MAKSTKRSTTEKETMKLLHLASDFAPSSPVLLSTATSVEKPTGLRSHSSTRYTPIVLFILLVFAGFSLTVPLHPSRSTDPDSCSNATALAPGTDGSDCSDLATVPANYNVVIKSITNLAVNNLPSGSRSSLSEAINPDPSRNVTLTGRVPALNHIS